MNNSFRSKFPILTRSINGHPLVYLDNASTTQKPYEVLTAMADFYASHNANIHRGIHTLSHEATEAYESVREQVKQFIHAESKEEIIFTSGTTESLNTVAFGLRHLFKRGDEILLTEVEHHSNIVPWQIVAKERKLTIKYIPIGRNGRLDLRAYSRLLSKKTRVLAITHASNVTGEIVPLSKVIQQAHRRGALVVVDAAQSVAHLPINVSKLDCDFLAFSGHKLYGPTGVGVLYGKSTLLEKLEPFKYGGHMIERVEQDGSTFTKPPGKFEAGTAPLAEVMGFGAAILFVQGIGWQTIQSHEKAITAHALEKLSKIEGLTIMGPTEANNRIGVVSFTLEGVPAHDIASLLDEQGIAIRSGHHCAQLLHSRLGSAATTRASIACYTTRAQIDLLAKTLESIQEKFHVR